MLMLNLSYIQGGSKKTGTLCFVRLTFVKYWPILKLILLSESSVTLTIFDV